MFCSFVLFKRWDIILVNEIEPSLFGSNIFFISLSSYSVGQWPKPLTNIGNCEVGIVPLSYLSKMENNYW